MNQTAPSHILQALRQHITQLDAAWDARDAHAFAQLFEPRADFGSYGAPLLKGRDAIEEHYAEAVFPRLDPAHRHHSRILSTRSVTNDVVVGDAEVDIYTQDGPEPNVLHTVPTVGVFVQREGAWSISAIRLMPPRGSNE
jgi:uncharacterized protein (TIGR02246 family)